MKYTALVSCLAIVALSIPGPANEYPPRKILNFPCPAETDDRFCARDLPTISTHQAAPTQEK